VRDNTRKETFVHELNPGDMFGEVGLIFQTKRTASVKSKDQCTIGAINEEIFAELCKEFPEIIEKMKQ
jgi:CRP-like cAMP-binding protein